MYRKEWRLIEKQGRVDQLDHRYYSNGAEHITGQPIDKWQGEVQIEGNIPKQYFTKRTVWGASGWFLKWIY